MSKTKVAVIQYAMGPDPAANLRKASGLIRKAAAKGGKVMFLPELFDTIYFAHKESKKYFAWARDAKDAMIPHMSALAKETGVVIVVPYFEKRSRGLYHNSAIVIDADGKVLGQYRKMHIPDDPGFYEKYYFAPGDLGFKVFKTRYADIGVLICWDQWYPEAARITALKGAEILFYPTAIGWLPTEPRPVALQQRRAWQTVQTSHAIANGVYVAAVNRNGTENRTRFWGSSFVAGPDGGILKQASETKEEILIVDCDFSRIERSRQEWPFLRDRRIDAYKPILSRFLDE